MQEDIQLQKSHFDKPIELALSGFNMLCLHSKGIYVSLHLQPPFNIHPYGLSFLINQRCHFY